MGLFTFRNRRDADRLRTGLNGRSEPECFQKDALFEAGCERIFEDRLSGAKAERPGLSEALEYARAGDTLAVWRLDRLSRSLKDLIEMVTQLESLDIGLKSLHEVIDTSSSTGKLVFHLFGALAEFERNLIRERTRAGLRAARIRGRQGGRPKALDRDRRDSGREAVRRKAAHHRPDL